MHRPDVVGGRGRHFADSSSRRYRGCIGLALACCVALMSTSTAKADVAFESPAQSTPLGAWVVAVTVADVTGDSRPDAIALTGRSSGPDDPTKEDKVVVLPHRADHSLGDPIRYDTTTNDCCYYGSVAAEDLDNDGDNDLVAAQGAGLDLYFQHEGQLTGPHELHAVNAPEPEDRFPASTRSAQIADMDGDGLKDIVVGTYTHGTLLLRQTPEGWVSRSISPAPEELQEVEIGDLNDDGRPDAVSADFPNVRIATALADGSYSDTSFYVYGLNGIDVADLDGDGRDDLVAATSYYPPLTGIHRDAMLVYRQSEAGLVDEPAYCRAGRSPQPVETADLDGDGLREIVTVNTIGAETAVFMQLASGDFSDQFITPTHQGLGHLFWSTLAVADINGDGERDVVIGGQQTSDVIVLRQTPASGPPVPPPKACDIEPPTVEISDEPVELTPDGHAPVELACAESEASGVCEIGLDLKTVEKLTYNGETERFDLGREFSKLGSGERKSIPVDVPEDMQRLIARQDGLMVKATVNASDEKDNSGTFTEAFFLSPPPDQLPLPPLCDSWEPTIVGGEGDDELSGTSGRDVIVAVEGDDTVKARRGNDIVCGGQGRDGIRGGRGKDLLLGEGGRDELDGDRGRDTCVGGPGRDALTQC